ncbi:MAG: menaquinone biosynthesis protein [Armatimonadota bacterium]|nr:menaquinone biosynthesis protein [Armatimonadota bacterium]
MKFKLGTIPYLNGKPLTYGLDGEPAVELVTDVPSRLAEMLKAHEIAAGLVSSVACFMNQGLQIIPGISISCRGPAESVKIFHKTKPEEIATVALDTSSLTSVLLAKVILRERYNLTPKFISMPPSVEEMLDACDAAVVIGDTAMKVQPGRWAEIDLGSEWYSLTGLPFVFAFWAVNPEMVSPELIDILHRAKLCGLGALSEIAKSESRRLGLSFEKCYHYLRDIMVYDLTNDHLESLNIFSEKIRKFGLNIPQKQLKLFATQ